MWELKEITHLCNSEEGTPLFNVRYDDGREDLYGQIVTTPKMAALWFDLVGQIQERIQGKFGLAFERADMWAQIVGVGEDAEAEDGPEDST